MHDRQPGAPGQYKAVIAAEELLKMQAGDQFVITMTRDDQPIKEGTPYSKASVLPDDLAEQICPGVTDPTPADAFRGVAAQRCTATLNASAWTGETAPYTQTVAVTWMLSMDHPHVSLVYSGDNDTRIAQREAWGMVDDIDSGDGTITFTCFEGKPEADITIQIEVNR